jgi:putative ABC transport system substrate-binding protein
VLALAGTARHRTGRELGATWRQRTGLSAQSADLAGKRLELLREVVSGLRRLAILTNVGYPSSVLETGEVQAAALTLGLEVVVLEIRRAEDIAPAFRLSGSRGGALSYCRSAPKH